MFIDDVTSLLNRYSCENASNTPDFILATYLLACLDAWNAGVTTRDAWYGFNQRILVDSTSSTVGSTGDLSSSPVPLTAEGTGLQHRRSAR